MNITDLPKLTEATTVYLLPMNVDEVDPNRRFNVDETIRLIKDLSNRHAEAPTRNVDTLVNTAAKNWKMKPNDPEVHALFRIVLSTNRSPHLFLCASKANAG